MKRFGLRGRSRRTPPDTGRARRAASHQGFTCAITLCQWQLKTAHFRTRAIGLGGDRRTVAPLPGSPSRADNNRYPIPSRGIHAGPPAQRSSAAQAARPDRQVGFVHKARRTTGTTFGLRQFCIEDGNHPVWLVRGHFPGQSAPCQPATFNVASAGIGSLLASESHATTRRRRSVRVAQGSLAPDRGDVERGAEPARALALPGHGRRRGEGSDGAVGRRIRTPTLNAAAPGSADAPTMRQDTPRMSEPLFARIRLL